MSNNDSLDEETKAILAGVDSDDSKKSIPKEKKVTEDADEHQIGKDDKWETNDEETPDSEW